MSTILERWKISAEELTKIVEENPSLRGFLFGYISEYKARTYFEGHAGVTDIRKYDDHDRTSKGDISFCYKGREFRIEAKSLQTNSVVQVGNGLWRGKFQCDASDRREICTGLTIQNNRIDDAANEDWGCIGIGTGYVRDIKILHNEISNVSYTGISLGWGWNQQTCAMANNLVKGNYIHHYARHMYDTAGIYTLGSQPHTFIEENVVDSIYTPGYVHDPEHWFYLYTDEGSSYITVRNNWTPAEKFLRNSNGPGCTWENNGPMVSDSIKGRAGKRINPEK